MTRRTVVFSLLGLALSATSAVGNPHGEDSKGLWQINASRKPTKGQDISPWTTAHGGRDARYIRLPSSSIRPMIGLSVRIR